MSLPACDPVTLSRGAVEHRARGYQLEMLEESLKGNIIVAVITQQPLSDVKVYSDKGRWIPEVVKRTCSSPKCGNFVRCSLSTPLLAVALAIPLTKTHRAVLRIIAELERCPPEKVCGNQPNLCPVF
jgi:hypothetical protein